MNIPEIYMEEPSLIWEGEFQEDLIPEYDIFFRRYIEIFEGDIEDRCVPIVMLLDGVSEYYMYLDMDFASESLKRAVKYFEWIEEYEVCDAIMKRLP